MKLSVSKEDIMMLVLWFLLWPVASFIQRGYLDEFLRIVVHALFIQMVFTDADFLD